MTAQWISEAPRNPKAVTRGKSGIAEFQLRNEEQSGAFRFAAAVERVYR
jgi:hypothetical protein